MRQLGAQERGLQGVEAEIAADERMMIFRLHAVHAKDGRAFGEIGVVRAEQAGVAKRAEIFGGVKTKRAAGAERAGLAAMIFCAEGLRGVFDDGEVVRPREGENAIHVRGLAIEVHGDDGLGAWGDFFGGVGHIEVEAGRADIHEDGRGAHARDAASGGEKGEVGHEHFVARADVEGHEREQEGIGAGGNAEGVRDAEELGALALEGGVLGAEDVVAGMQDALKGGLQIGFEGEVLAF